MITLTKKELCVIKEQVCASFIDSVKTSNSLNRVGNKRDFDNEVELMAYLDILDTLTLPPKVNYFDNDYVSLLSNRDIFNIQYRALQIQGNNKRKTL